MAGQTSAVFAAPPGFWSLPLAARADRLQATLATWNSDEVDRARLVLSLTYALLARVVALATTACFWRAGVEPRGAHLEGFWRRPSAYAALAVLAGAADLLVTARYESVIGAFRRDGAVTTDADWLAAAAASRVAFSALVAFHLVRLLPQRLAPPLGGAWLGPADRRPGFLRPRNDAAGPAPHPWEPPAHTERVGIGIGDGIGPDAALDALRTLRRNGVLADAGCLATTTAAGPLAGVLSGAVDLESPGRSPPGGRGVPARSLLRRAGAIGDGLVVAASGVLLLALLVAAVARPVGWALSSDVLHPELRARRPALSLVEPMHAGARRLATLAPAQAAASTTPGTVALFELLVSWRELRVEVDTGPGGTTSTRLPVLLERPGIIALRSDRLIVAQQPLLRVDTAPLGPAATAGWSRDAPIEIERQPTYGFPQRSTLDAAELDALLDRRAGPELLDEVAELLDLESAPSLRMAGPLGDRDPWAPRPWAPWAMLAAASLAALAAVGGPLARRPTTPLVWGYALGRRAAAGAAIGAASVALLTVVLPWAAAGVAPGGWPLAAMACGSVVVAAAAAQVRPAVAFAGRTRLGWTALGGAALLLELGAAAWWAGRVLQVAAANGPFGARAGELGGHLGELGGLGWPGGVPELVRWLVVVLALLVWWRVVDTRARPAMRWPASASIGRELGPQLVVCAAARPPAARRGVAAVAPFTVSAAEVGGPQLGYLAPALLDATLGPARRGDVSLGGALALVGEPGHHRGAAEPARWLPWGPLRTLGGRGRAAWVCHPEWVQRFVEVEEPETRWRDRPSWPYLLRELAWRLPHGGRYVAIEPADAVASAMELLRRGCTVLYLIGLSGDDDTLAALLARAAAELGVEVQFDTARDALVTGRIRHPARARHDRRAVPGRIVVVGEGEAQRAIDALGAPLPPWPAAIPTRMERGSSR